MGFWGIPRCCHDKKRVLVTVIVEKVLDMKFKRQIWRPPIEEAIMGLNGVLGDPLEVDYGGLVILTLCYLFYGRCRGSSELNQKETWWKFGGNLVKPGFWGFPRCCPDKNSVPVIVVSENDQEKKF